MLIASATFKTGGENVYPAEVEAEMARHPAVQEACVFGVPNSYWGETIKAVVVLRSGQQATAAELVACRERLAGYKRPRFIVFLRSEDLPRSTTGKLQHHEIVRRPITEERRV